MGVCPAALSNLISSVADFTPPKHVRKNSVDTCKSLFEVFLVVVNVALDDHLVELRLHRLDLCVHGAGTIDFHNLIATQDQVGK